MFIPSTIEAHSHLTRSQFMLTADVDRNDKSRICIPGSVKVLGRRQIELYSRLIHTVDHVEGYLREGFDALDAFLCHTWAVTGMYLSSYVENSRLSFLDHPINYRDLKL